MSFFKKLFSPLQSRFKKMDTLMQNRIALSVSLAGHSHRAVENEIFQKLLLPILGTSISPDLKKTICTELAIGMVACVRIPDKQVLNEVWSLEGESLRQMVAMLVFSENSDSRHVLENARYSSNPDEARVQVLLAIVRLIGSKDDTLITRINTQAFGKEWNGFATEFVDGSITGFRRMQRSAMIGFISGKLKLLSPLGQQLIEEFIKTCAEVSAKSPRDPASLRAPNSRAQILYNSARKKAEELRNQIASMIGLTPLEVQQLLKMVQVHWLSICVPYVAILLFLSQLKKDAYFAKSDEFAVIYGQSVLLMVSLQKEHADHMGFLDMFDQKSAEAIAQQELGEMEEAMLFYIDFFKKIPFPDTKLLDLFMAKVGVADNLRPQFSVKLREFNQQALAEFATL